MFNMEGTLFLVISHWPDGPTIWTRSSIDKAESLAKKLLLDELDGNTASSLAPEDIAELRSLIEHDTIYKANDFWTELQREANMDFVEGFEIRSADVDGEDSAPVTPRVATVYQFTLAGYNGGTSDTDHLVKWAVAYCVEDVNALINALELKVEHSPHATDLEPCVAGIDYNLMQENWLNHYLANTSSN